MGRVKNYERTEVIRQARDVFWQKGYSETSLQDLEKATGVNKSGLYAEFKSKDEIYVQCLKQYSVESGVLDLLARKPLGWANIDQLLRSSNCPASPKGCFMVNSVRELSILPAAAKKKIHEHLATVNAAMIANLRATGASEKEAEKLAQMILTFNSGLALAQNLGDTGDFDSRVDFFLKQIR